MQLTPDDFRDAMPPHVWDAVRHYRETGEVIWTPPTGTPTEPESPACAVCRDLGRLAIRRPSQLQAEYVDCTVCDIAVTRSLAKIHRDFRDATFARYLEAARTTDAAAIGQAMYEWANTGPGSCLLMGEFGALKTTLGTAAWRYRVEHRMATAAEWVIVPDFLETIRASYDLESGLVTSLIFGRACTSDLLLFDDLGSEKVTDRNRDWVQEQLYRLINWRSNQQLPTIFTTNLSLAQLTARVGRAIVSRIEGMCGPRIWLMDQGVDFRRVPR
jgi:DNA replication protein DnaC